MFLARERTCLWWTTSLAPAESTCTDVSAGRWGSARCFRRLTPLHSSLLTPKTHNDHRHSVDELFWIIGFATDAAWEGISVAQV